MDKDAVTMTDAEVRGQGSKGSKSSINMKVHPNIVLGVDSLVNERHSGGKGVVAKYIFFLTTT